MPKLAAPEAPAEAFVPPQRARARAQLGDGLVVGRENYDVNMRRRRLCRGMFGAFGG